MTNGVRPGKTHLDWGDHEKQAQTGRTDTAGEAITVDARYMDWQTAIMGVVRILMVNAARDIFQQGDLSPGQEAESRATRIMARRIRYVSVKHVSLQPTICVHASPVGISELSDLIERMDRHPRLWGEWQGSRKAGGHAVPTVDGDCGGPDWASPTTHMRSGVGYSALFRSRLVITAVPERMC